MANISFVDFIRIISDNKEKSTVLLRDEVVAGLTF